MKTNYTPIYITMDQQTNKSKWSEYVYDKKDFSWLCATIEIINEKKEAWDNAIAIAELLIKRQLYFNYMVCLEKNHYFGSQGEVVCIYQISKLYLL